MIISALWHIQIHHEHTYTRVMPHMSNHSYSVIWSRVTHIQHIKTNTSSWREVGGWGRVPFSRNLMSPTPRRKWYLTTGRRFHSMVLDPIPQSLPVHFFGSRPQPPTSHHVGYTPPSRATRINWDWQCDMKSCHTYTTCVVYVVHIQHIKTNTTSCRIHTTESCHSYREVGGWGRDPQKCTGRDWGMGSSTI